MTNFITLQNFESKLVPKHQIGPNLVKFCYFPPKIGNFCVKSTVFRKFRRLRRWKLNLQRLKSESSNMHSEFLATFWFFCAMQFGGGSCFSANLVKINWPFCAVEFESGLTLQLEKINENFVDYFHASEKDSEQNFPVSRFKSARSPKF